MKSLFLILALFSLINSVYAQNLCDESCEFSANFPEGGSLEANDELTLTFGMGGELILGTGGTVNTAIQPSTLDFSSGGTLTLSTGDSITFGPGGSLVLGTGGNMSDGNSITFGPGGSLVLCTGGNMDAQNYNLTSTGDITIGATGGNQTIHLNGGLDTSGALSLTSPSLEINSTITAGSQLNLENSTTISGWGSITVPESATVTIGNVVTEHSLSFSLSSDNGEINSTGSLNPGSFQPLQNLDALNGMEILTSDGNNCIVASPECIADDGTVYVLSAESKLVKKEAPSDTSTGGKSGSVDLPFLSSFMILLLLSGTRKTLKS